jgi:hypothetical protein
MAGYRGYDGGTVFGEGSNGYYWSSIVGGTFSWGLLFDSGDAGMYYDGRAYGLSVRCIKD